MNQFIGRNEELERLKNIKKLSKASFIVVKGRRRIGKTRLLQEFGKQFEKMYIFSGLPPRKGITNTKQQIEFVKQFNHQIPNVNLKQDDWSDLFWELSKYVQQGSVLVVLDEISWMGGKDPDFLGKLKNAWDLYFKKNDQLVFAVCASASYWIDKNLLSGTGFVGRVSLRLTLEELSLKDCLSFWKTAKGVSEFNILKLLSVTGGIPRYLESIQPHLSAEENIKQLCFMKDALLVNEFDDIFSDLFSKKSARYQQIINVLAEGMRDQKELSTETKISSGGKLSEYLEDLISAGFISREYSWNIKDGKLAKLSQYRLKDNYARFYLKYILPRKSSIEQGDLKEISIADLPAWNSIMGLQLENLILNNRTLIKKTLELKPSDVICDNPFFQRRSSRRKGCQIDYLIQTKLNVLYICEIKFSKKEINRKIIDEMQEKIDRLNIPKYFSTLPVLIHVGEVSDAVEDSAYFTKIINFIDLIKEEMK